jgi:hypothetical protein
MQDLSSVALRLCFGIDAADREISERTSDHLRHMCGGIGGAEVDRMAARRDRC